MADLNEVRLIGRLTRDPELRALNTGTSVCKFGLATGRRYRGQDGNLIEETTFVDIECWGKIAENVSRYLKKGRSAFVGGRLKLDTWQDKTTGQNRTRLYVIADNIQFLDRADASNSYEGDNSYAQGGYVPQGNYAPQGGYAPQNNYAPQSSNDVPWSTPNSDIPDGPPSWDMPDLGKPQDRKSVV